MDVFPYFNMFHVPCSNQIPKYINNQQMHFNIYNVFYSLNSHQLVSISIAAIFRVILLKENKGTNVVSCVAVTP
jgi:hypothetical protein